VMCDTCAWESALEQIEQAKEALDDLRSSRSGDRVQDYADSVEERIDDFAAWIEENEHVTARQEEALQNIIAGMEKWLQ